MEMEKSTKKMNKDTYWIQVSGIRLPSNSSACWLDGGGYESYREAADAGGTAVKWALDNGGVIPDTFPKGWLAPSWKGASPYITNKPKKRYRINNDIINEIHTINEAIEILNKILNALGE